MVQKRGQEECVRTMDRTFEYRIYPSAGQKVLLQKTFGCCRWVYNKVLAMRRDEYARMGKSKCINSYITQIPTWKKTDAPWLSEVDSTALQQSLRDLYKAYRNFFRAPGKVGFPKFKSKQGRQSYRTSRFEVVDEHHVKLPKLGVVKARVSHSIEGRILSATVKQVPSGKYFVTVCCTDVPKLQLLKTSKVVGIDLGIKTEIVCSNERIFESPKAYGKAQHKLAREQRKLSRKQKGSANYAKQKRKVALCHEKIANQRKDFTNKATTALVNENQVICAETLNVKGMVKNRRLAKSVADAAFGEILRQLAYKCEWRGRKFVQVSMWYPSSKTCSCCGHIQNMPLQKRTYRCPSCGMVMNRDLNAAKNILTEGLRMLGQDMPEVNACEEGVRPTAACTV